MTVQRLLSYEMHGTSEELAYWAIGMRPAIEVA